MCACTYVGSTCDDKYKLDSESRELRNLESRGPWATGPKAF